VIIENLANSLAKGCCCFWRFSTPPVLILTDGTGRDGTWMDEEKLLKYNSTFMEASQSLHPGIFFLILWYRKKRESFQKFSEICRNFRTTVLMMFLTPKKINI
jgi:hypothetical protein